MNNLYQISDSKKKKKHGDSWNKFSVYVFLLLLPSFISEIVLAQALDDAVITRADHQALQAIKREFTDFQGVLRSWNDTGYGACSGKWVGIKCYKGRVTAIQLPWKGLGGRISEKIGELQDLQRLSLHDNVLSGSIPWSLGLLHNLRGVYLFNNQLSGSIPPSIGNCKKLQSLDLSRNSLNGSVPANLGNLTRLYRLNLSFNSFSAQIPSSLTRLSSLTILDLQHNNLSNDIPDSWNYGQQIQILKLDNNELTGKIPVSISKLIVLQEFSLSQNQISGPIPVEVSQLSNLQKLDLSENIIDGSIPMSISNLSLLVSLNLKNNNMKGSIPETIGNISTISSIDLSHNSFTGGIPLSLARPTNLTVFNVSYNNLSGSVPSILLKRFNSSSFAGNLQLCGYSISTPCASQSPQSMILLPKHNDPKLSTKDIILIVAGLLLVFLFVFCCILLCCLVRKRSGDRGQNGKTVDRGVVSVEDAVSQTEVGNSGGKLVHFDGPFVFTADDLLCATAEIMGKSTYGTAYKATLEDENQVAVKRLKEKTTKGQREFEVEAAVIGKIRHPNLLALRAYYLGPKGEKLLVFDYMSKGSLSSFLHARGPETVIDWATRMNITMGVAKGLVHLHTQEKMIHENLTSSNILLDEQNNPHIADFGLSKLMTSAANTNIIATAGSLGYRAPELSKLKDASTKTDVYSLGVIILELLTGKSPGEAMNGVDLPQWVTSIVKEEWTNEVFDVELMRDAQTIGDELLNTLKLALHCIDPDPAARPEVQQVLQQLQEIKPDLAVSADDKEK